MMDSEVRHRKVGTNGLEMHIAEQGRSGGPLVVLLHGFPELWISWRHQMRELANQGYHVVAPDMRGYGDTDSPPSPSSYTYFHLVGDIIGLLDHLGHHQQKAFVVGHDWGAWVAWYLSLFRPDRVRALVILGVPYMPRSATTKPTESFNRLFGEGFYISQFQDPGRAEKSFSHYDCYTIMKKFLLIMKPDLLIAPPDMEIIDFLDTPTSLPPWLTEEELQYFASKFQKSGFTGPLNYYRAMDLNWELLAPWQGSTVTAPTKFIVGDKDIGFSLGTKDYVEGEVFKSFVPKVEVVIMDGHHFIQQEKAEEDNESVIKAMAK
ncbi:hypothetical protein MRB53_024350 [Persea americana]|uniref:Uncharacterized protein n=1 Tax=Persea americana TaxID=3435 RepID=A0ACC2LCD7_PERAE|nr:hypothetical protein MRB53_024350 [Persea americana]